MSPRLPNCGVKYAAPVQASLPSLDELRGKLVGLLQAPGTRLAVLFQATAGQIARVLAAYAERQGEATSSPVS